MKFINYLKEEYLMLGKSVERAGHYQTYPIYKNPDKKEMRYCGKWVRLVIDLKNRNLYACDSNLLHFEILRSLGMEDEKYLVGVEAELDQGKFRMTDSYLFRSYNWEPNWRDNYSDISWLKQYFILSYGWSRFTTKVKRDEK